MAIVIAFLYARLSRSKRKRAEYKQRQAEETLKAEHESNALLSDRLGQEKQEVKNATDDPDIDHFSK